MPTTYFTFADGRLDYDCAACRQRCCRGKGFALDLRESTPLLAHEPGLAAHLRLGRGGALMAFDVTDGCWFLEDDGRCRLERSRGRAAKPLTCKLFPFNRIYRVGEVRVVDMNSVLCPLEPARGQGVTHEEIEREIGELEGSPLLDVAAWQPMALDSAWLERERAAARVAIDQARSPDAMAAAMGDAAAASLARAWSRFFDMTESERQSLEPEVAAHVALLAPSLRWNLLFRKEARPYTETLTELPRRLRALTFLGTQALRMTGRLPGLRSLSEMWQGEGQALDVLTRWDRQVQVREPRFATDIAEPLRPALGVLLSGAFRGGKTLGELVEATAGALPPGQGVLAVALAGAQLETLFR